MFFTEAKLKLWKEEERFVWEEHFKRLALLRRVSPAELFMIEKTRLGQAAVEKFNSQGIVSKWTASV